MNFFDHTNLLRSGSADSSPALSSAGRSELRELERRIDKLEMVCEGMWRLLQEKAHLTDTELIERIAEIDLEDGRYDGQKKTPSFRECSKCGRKNNKSLPSCMYCGELFIAQPFD